LEMQSLNVEPPLLLFNCSLVFRTQTGQVTVVEQNPKMTKR